MKEIYDNPNAIFHYEYKNDVRSITKHVLKHLWSFVLRFVPHSWSANMITLIGNIGSIAAFLILSIFGASYGPTHTWIFPLAGFGILFYNTLDNIDGQQARRTKSSGPLGEFFDHWLDAFNVFFVPLGILTAFPVIPISWIVTIISAVLLSNWLAFREVQITKILYGSEISALEIITLSWLFLFSIFFTGYDFWVQPISNTSIAPIKIFAFITMIGSVVSVLHTWWRLRASIKTEMVFYWVSLLPISIWIISMGKVDQSYWFMLWGLMIQGAASARMTINLIRVRLFGLKTQIFYLDTLIPSILLFILTLLQEFVSSMFVYGTIFIMIILTGIVLFAVSMQIYYSLKRVKDVLGIPLFYHGERHGQPKTQPNVSNA